MTTPDSERFNLLLKALELTPNAFMKQLGYGKQNQIAYYILNGRNGISSDFAEKIVTYFPQFRKEWILSGVGEMYKAFSAPEITENVFYYTMPDNSMYPNIIKGDVLKLTLTDKPDRYNFYFIEVNQKAMVRYYDGYLFKAYNPDYPAVDTYSKLAIVNSLTRNL